MLFRSRPVVVEETGWSRHLPSGTGAVPFSSLEEAAEALDRVSRDYHRHAEAARRMAEDFFESKKVCRDLLARI